MKLECCGLSQLRRLEREMQHTGARAHGRTHLDVLKAEDAAGMHVALL